MVFLILVCEALGNGLKGGLLNIVNFTFNKLPQVTHHRIMVKHYTHNLSPVREAEEDSHQLVLESTCT